MSGSEEKATNDDEARGVREELRETARQYLLEWDGTPEDGEEFMEGAVMYALRRDREEREELHGEQIERAFKDGWGAALKRLDSLGAKLESLAILEGYKIYWAYSRENGLVRKTILKGAKIPAYEFGWFDTPDEAVDKALEEMGEK